MGGVTVASIFEVEQARALERAEAVLRVLDLKARNAGISYASHPVGAIPADAREIICASARLHDLTIVTQPQSDHDSYDNIVPQEILFRAGGPVLFMPYTFHGAFSAKRIGIFWDGSRLAARALHDAMPLLRKADTLTVITITGPDAIPAKGSTDHLVRYLATSGVPAKVMSVPASRSIVKAVLRSVAADERLDLVVAGGYSHAWMKKTLGRLPRDMFQMMSVPVLMSH
ncbi:universal stress protein [Bradyrhizobium erythrophlei]|uniref:universal stress protein n=1 Tax=Bradyrhizobium erythrophlei TaxID=1437360 RepID=UPI0035EEAB4C